MLIYILKTALIQFSGLAIYFVLLRNEKLFSYARKFLWAVIVSSFVIPFISIPIFETTEIVQTISEIPQNFVYPEVNIVVAPKKSLDLSAVVLIVYCLITALSLAKFFLAYQKIINIKKRATFQEPNIYVSKEIHLPYSFLKNIYIPSSFAKQESLELILAHENAHIQKKHSYDKLAISLLVHLFIFNPLFRVFHKELELIHEYEVDESVIQEHSLESYLKSLLQSTIYLQSSKNSLTHSFFSSPIKNRIIMLHKKSKNKNLRKITTSICMLSVFCLMVFFQSQKVYALQDNLVQTKVPQEDTAFVDNGDGSYTMKYKNERGGEVLKVVSAEKMLSFLNRSTDSNSNWSLGEDNGLVLNTARNKKAKEIMAVEKGDTLISQNPDGTYKLMVNDNNGKITTLQMSAKELADVMNGNNPEKKAFSVGDDNQIQITINTGNENPKSGDINSKFQGGENVELNPNVITTTGPFADGTSTVMNNKTGEITIQSDGNETYTGPDYEAQFPGGAEALSNYINKNLKLRNELKEAAMSAKAYVQFRVNADGTIADVYLLKTETTIQRDSKASDKILKQKFDNEARRIVENMPNWKPAYNNNGELVSSKVILPIVFRATE